MTVRADAAPLQHNAPRGIAAMAFAVFFFSFADAFGKWFGQAGFDSIQIVFLRYTFGLIPVAAKNNPVSNRPGRG